MQAVSIMQPDQDAFGQMMAANQRGGAHEPEIIERDDGYVSVGRGPSLYFASYDSWSPIEREASTYVRGRVLDIGCGAGRHALYFQGQGYEVVATDISPLAVQVCQERGVRDARVFAVTQLSHTLGLFDTITLWGSFAMVSNFKRARWLLRRFRGMTTNQGRIIAAALNPYGTDDPAHLAYHEHNRQQGRVAGQTRVRVRFRQYATPWLDLLFVSPDELRDILAGTGWQMHQLLGDEHGQYIVVIDKA
jgi:2-polyprenyl-3-methyl-5-hydroxy-6-metoxy-1,4-benzoquinol methylase